MSSAIFGSISISISDEENEELSGRMRVRVRRKRRKPSGPHAKGEMRRWFLRKLMRWWTLLLFLPALVMILFEVSRIPRKPQPIVEVKISGPANGTQSHGNLGRLDPTTRFVGGARERCLKLLPPDEMQHLEFPAVAESNFPIKQVLYKSDQGASQSGENSNTSVSQQDTDGTRFNLFTGYQSLDEREESFKVDETAVVHCGFYSENGGFHISDDDKSYMKTCKVVVSTCAFGGGDDLYQPIGMIEASIRQVCYVAFWDEITRSAQEAEGNTMDDKHMIGKWRIVIVKNLPFTDQRLNGKIPKMLSHRLFLQARYSIWVDSKSQFRRDPLGVLETLLWRTKSVLAISEHGARSSVYDEGKAVIKKNKATPEEVEIQFTQYRKDGFADIKRFNGKKALSEASVILREHTPQTNLLMCLWFNEVVRFTSRDQLSFPYVLRRLNIPGINMFPVCTRKDLVNSMGHKRKVKPLVT